MIEELYAIYEKYVDSETESVYISNSWVDTNKFYLNLRRYVGVEPETEKVSNYFDRDTAVKLHDMGVPASNYTTERKLAPMQAYLIKDAYSGIDWYVTKAQTAGDAVSNMLRGSSTIAQLKKVPRPEVIPLDEDSAYYDVFMLSEDEYDKFVSGELLLTADNFDVGVRVATYFVAYTNPAYSGEK
jgi:hypothetical protein